VALYEHACGEHLHRQIKFRSTCRKLQASKQARTHTHTHTHTHTQTHICIHASQIIRSCIDIGDALGAIQKNGEESASPEPKSRPAHARVPSMAPSLGLCKVESMGRKAPPGELVCGSVYVGVCVYVCVCACVCVCVCESVYVCLCLYVSLSV